MQNFFGQQQQNQPNISKGNNYGVSGGGYSTSPINQLQQQHQGGGLDFNFTNATSSNKQKSTSPIS